MVYLNTRNLVGQHCGYPIIRKALSNLTALLSFSRPASYSGQRLGFSLVLLFLSICLFEWRVAEKIQGQRARCPLCRGHLYTFSIPTTRPQLSDFRDGLEVEIVRLRLTLEIVTSSRRTTMSDIAVRDLRSSPGRSGQFHQL